MGNAWGGTVVLDRRILVTSVVVIGILLFLMAISASPAWAQTLSVDTTGSPGTVENGDEITYTIVVSNSDDTAANGVTLTDQVPDGTEFVSVDPVGNCGEDGGTVTCDDLAPITAGRPSVPITLTVKVDGTEDTITNKATADANNADAVTSDPVTTTLGSGSASAQYDQYRPNVEITNIINIPDKALPDTGGPPMLGIFFSIVAGAGLLTAVVRRRY